MRLRGIFLHPAAVPGPQDRQEQADTGHRIVPARNQQVRSQQKIPIHCQAHRG